MARRSRFALSLGLSLLVCASAQATTVIGPGQLPGLAVDPNGTAYLAWNGPGGDPSPLHFCRLPRGASACAGGVKVIATRGTAGSRAFLTVEGSRVVVVQGRYGSDVAGFSGVYAHTSTDGGETFGPAKLVGKHFPHDAVAGPGDTMSLVTHSGGWFQNVPTDGSAPVDAEGRSTTGAAQLFTDEWHGTGAVGLIDAATPLAVFAINGGSSIRYRRYSGSGPVNDASSWAGPVQLSVNMQSYKLVSGPAGLFLISVEGDHRVTARKWLGTEFGEAALIAPSANWATLHASQDGGGRLHVTFADGSRLVHAASDDGAGWRSGTFSTLTEGGFGEPRVAAAPDHAGVVAWNGGPSGAPDIRIAAVGPDAPADPAPGPPPPPTATPAPSPAKKPQGRLSLTGSAKRKERIVAVKLTLKLVLPTGVSRADGCSGKVTVTLLKGKKTLGSRTGKISTRTCTETLKGSLKRSAVGTAKSLRLRVRFGGNAALAESVQDKGTLRIR